MKWNLELHRVLRPEFVHAPLQFLRAVGQKIGGDPVCSVICRLPWGEHLEADPREFIGLQVYRYGVTALEACETAFRLVGDGDTAVDAGANIGVVTSAMAIRVGTLGKVIAIEMMPQTYEILIANVARWGAAGSSVTAINCAVSDDDGEIDIGLSEDFARNKGVAYASRETIPSNHRKERATCRKLDSILDGFETIQLLKLDLERHEFNALKGARRLIGEQRIHFIVFEDANAAHTPAKEFLAGSGYTLYRIEARLRGPKLVGPLTANCDGLSPTSDYVDFVATTQPEKLIGAFAAPGYCCLGSCSVP